jgi:hypothetical protein
MTMIEKVARAICKDCYINFDKLTEKSKQATMRNAKAAIEAMREPNEQMMKAGLEINVNDDGFKVFYKAMIDAALKE